MSGWVLIPTRPGVLTAACALVFHSMITMRRYGRFSSALPMGHIVVCRRLLENLRHKMSEAAPNKHWQMTTLHADADAAS